MKWIIAGPVAYNWIGLTIITEKGKLYHDIFIGLLEISIIWMSKKVHWNQDVSYSIKSKCQKKINKCDDS